MEETKSILTFLFGGVGQYVILGCIVLFVAGGRLAKFLTKFKIFKAGPVELESHDPDTASLCPHKGCEEKRDKIVNKIFERIDEGVANRESMNDNLEKIAERLESIELEVTKAFKELADVRVDQYKLVFYNTTIPDAERLVAGLRYIQAGFNHQMKHDTIVFALANRMLYEAIVAGTPLLRVDEIEERLAAGSDE